MEMDAVSIFFFNAMPMPTRKFDIKHLLELSRNDVDGAAGIGESVKLFPAEVSWQQDRSEGHASVTVPPPRAVAIGRWEEGGEHGRREGWPPHRIPPATGSSG